MGILSRKISSFIKKVADLPDRPGGTITTAVLKAQFDSSPEELRVAFNGVVDDLSSTTAGASGAQQIGSETIAGVAGNDVYTQIKDVKTQLSNVVLNQIPDNTISTAKLNFSPAITGSDVLSRLIAVDGTGSGLDADKVDGFHLRMNGTLEVDDGTGWKPVGGIKAVQRGEATILDTATTTNVTISAVSLNKSFVNISFKTPTTALDTTLVKAKLTTATNLELNRQAGSPNANITIAWEVIESY